MVILISFIILLAIIVIGIPIPFAFLASTIFIVVFGGYDYTFLVPWGYQKVSTVILIAIPLFILSGALMEKGEIGQKLVGMLEPLIGRVKGGLGVVSVIACAMFGAISGSGAATLSCIGSIMFPRMEKAGYPRGHCAALLANACVLGLLIPPSLNMIVYAFVGGQSVLGSFLATVLPGVMLVVLLSIVNLWLLRKNTTIKVSERYDVKMTAELTLKKTFVAIPALLCPIIILGGIYGGAMTPTEAAAVSIFYAVPIGFLVYKGLTLLNLKTVIIEAATTSGVVMTMIMSIMMLSRLYVMENVPNKILDVMTNVSDNKIILLLMVNLFIIVIGMIMDDTSAIILCTPVLLPIVAALDVNGIQFAAILGVNIGMGCITPPCAPFLYLGARLGKASINEMLAPTGYYILFAWIPTLIITTFIPGFSQWLPTLILGEQILL